MQVERNKEVRRVTVHKIHGSVCNSATGVPVIIVRLVHQMLIVLFLHFLFPPSFEPPATFLYINTENSLGHHLRKLCVDYTLGYVIRQYKPYDNRKSIISHYPLFCCVANLNSNFFLSFGQHCVLPYDTGNPNKQMRVKVTQKGLILNRRRTQTSQNKTRSLNLKGGLLLSHGSGLGMTSLTRTRKPLTAAGWSPKQTQTPLSCFFFFFTIYAKSCQQQIR